jgi:hypothetical protein
VKLGLCGLLAAISVAPATAQEFMASGAASVYDDGDMQLNAATARGAVFFTQNFGVEGEFSFGAGDERLGNIAGVATNVKAGLGNDFAGYVIGRLPINDRFQLLGRLGYGSTEIEVEANFVGIGQASASDDVGGFRYGVGALLNFTPEYGLRADITRIEMDESDSGIEVDGGVNVYSLGMFLKF